jgi:hypothetical protein
MALEKMRVTANTTLGQIRDWLRLNLSNRVASECPACHNTVDIRRNTMHSGVGRMLVALYNAHAGDSYIHLSSLLARERITSHDTQVAARWGLIEEERIIREDGGRAGYWRLTTLGEQFVLGRAKVQKYALTFGTKFLGTEGDEISIQDVLGKKFDLQELLRWT